MICLVLTASDVATLRERWGSILYPEGPARHYATPELSEAVDAFIAASQALDDAERVIQDLARAEGWLPDRERDDLTEETS